MKEDRALCLYLFICIVACAVAAYQQDQAAQASRDAQAASLETARALLRTVQAFRAAISERAETCEEPRP